MIGDGNYIWRDIDGTLGQADNWNALPDDIEFLIQFAPAAPPEPHTQDDHDYMATFNDKLREVMTRCRR